jgi:purine-binding chemotaxis protein CheW
MTPWDDLRAVLHATTDILQQSEFASIDTLEQRTRQVAQPATSAALARDTIRTLTFTLGTERYAWLAQRVRAIAKVERITPVPSAPAYYCGVISLRGQVLSVMDLRVYLGLPAPEASADLVIVIDGAGLEVGVLATDIFDMVNLSLDKLTPASGAGLDPELVLGITTDGLTVLDAESLLRRERTRVEAESDKL